MTDIIDINDAAGGVAAPEWLDKSEAVHRQLRPHLPADYRGAMRRVFAQGGRMSVAQRGGEVVGVAVYRIYENTCYGMHMYVDDLITDERTRSTGVGKALLGHLQGLARRVPCANFILDSGTHRRQAHKFYLREGLEITAFHFGKGL